jgi:OOP family OmpA-OmpF porin
MLKKILLSTGIVVLGWSCTGLAEDDHAAGMGLTGLTEQWYVAPFSTYFNPAGDRNADHEAGAGLAIGKVLNDYFNVEVKGFWQHLDAENGGEGDISGGSVDLQYYMMRGAFSPYTVVGIGGMDTRFSNRSAASVLGEAGLGATYELFDNLSLRGDVRYRYSFEGDAGAYPGESQFHDMVVNVGLVIPLGQKPQSLPAPVRTVAAPVDDCSTRDSDADGVNDCLDRCPATLRSARVDDVGCPIRIELRGVNFLYDSAELTEPAKAILDGVAGQLRSVPEQRDIEVAGHASSEGSQPYNLNLSQRRSESVARYLKAQGLTNRLYPKGYGEDYPVADNDTEAGREKNRRVELVWMGD